MSSVPAQTPLNIQFNAVNRQNRMGDEKQSMRLGKRAFALKSDVQTVPEENDFGDDDNSSESQEDEDERLEMKELRTSEAAASTVLDNKRLTENVQTDSSPAGSLRRTNRFKHQLDGNQPSTSASASTNGSPLVSSISSPNFRRDPSIRSLKNYHHVMSDMQGEIFWFARENSTKSFLSPSGQHSSKPPSSVDSGYGMSMTQKPFSDAGSVRSWASVGMGSTDGKKMIVRRVPTSPVELFNIVNPPT
ncbi:hypothetical protein D910_10085 [Dendroctonus ponderosae]|uniref:Uncharacterized protein n=1 Tax=Dendroctonus ponderosae TaxID=77166 RepID=U4UID3_DENPD|nr:hypothetical protein D910_10085 [Dendroctonus ponderosae]